MKGLGFSSLSDVYFSHKFVTVFIELQSNKDSMSQSQQISPLDSKPTPQSGKITIRDELEIILGVPTFPAAGPRLSNKLIISGHGRNKSIGSKVQAGRAHRRKK